MVTGLHRKCQSGKVDRRSERRAFLFGLWIYENLCAQLRFKEKRMDRQRTLTPRMQSDLLQRNCNER